MITFGGQLIPVDDDIIAIIRQRVGTDGVVHLGERYHAGDRVVIVDGPLIDLIGVFEREAPASHRVTVLLTAVRCRARVKIDEASVRRLSE